VKNEWVDESTISARKSKSKDPTIGEQKPMKSRKRQMQ